MFEYIVEIISIAVSIKILERVENYLKNKKLLEIPIIGLLYLWVCFFVMFIIWAILASIFGYSTNNINEDWVYLILFSSVNGFSSRCFGKIGFWILLLFTLLLSTGAKTGGIGAIISMIFFFITRYYDRINISKTSSKKYDNKSENTDKLSASNDLDLLDSYLLKAKELSSKALEDFQNNNLNDAINKWNKSLNYYKKAEKIAKSQKDEELVSFIHKNIKSTVKNILNAKISLISDKLRGIT